MVFTTIDATLVPAAATALANANICLANIQENFIDNGGMEVWQRGTSFVNPSASGYTADRWQMNHNGTPVLTVTRDSTITDASPFSFKWNMTGVGGGTVFRMRTGIEASQLAGKTVTVSARVRVDSGGGGYVFVDLNDVNGQTPFVAANATTLSNGTWETIYVTRTLGANVTTLNFEFNFNNVAGVCYIDNVMGVIGSTPVSFVPLVPQVELARCQRFFYATPALSNAWICHGQCQSTTIASGVFRFPVPMRIGPTLTVNNQTNFQVWAANGAGVALTSLVNAGAVSNTDSYSLEMHVASGLVAGNATLLLAANANAQLFFSADF